MRQKQIIIVLLILGLGLLSSCEKKSEADYSGKDSITTEERGVDLTKEDINAILSSDEVKRFDEIRLTFLDYIEQAASNGFKMEEMQDLTLAALDDKQYEEELLKMIFNDAELGRQFIKDYTETQLDLVNKFPVLASMSSCNCDLKESTQFLYQNFSDVRTGVKEEMASRPAPLAAGGTAAASNLEHAEQTLCGSGANQVKLLACVALCSVSTSGIGTPFCGWLCWCTFCKENSQVGSSLC